MSYTYISKNPSVLTEGFSNKSLTMTYFHTGCSTIIGAKSFHGPVRDGKGWYQLAMVIRHDLSVPWRRIAAAVRQPKLEEVFCDALYFCLLRPLLAQRSMIR